MENLGYILLMLAGATLIVGLVLRNMARKERERAQAAPPPKGPVRDANGKFTKVK